jgi:hypothetical protein
MDKLTVAQAVELLRKHMAISWENREAIAALIESLEADAAAKNIALKEAWEGFTNLADLGVLPGEAYDEEARRLSLVCSKALGTTAGAALLARLEATKNGMTALEHIIKGAEGDEDDFGFWLRKGADALAAWRGGER